MADQFNEEELNVLFKLNKTTQKYNENFTY